MTILVDREIRQEIESGKLTINSLRRPAGPAQLL